MDRRTNNKTYTICVNYGNNNWAKGSGWVKGQSARLASIDNTGNKGKEIVRMEGRRDSVPSSPKLLASIVSFFL